MAVSQVRVLLNGVWTALSYNGATRCWEGTLTPKGTSFHQPGGYFNVTVEASSDGGSSVTADGERFAALRLVVRERVPPVLTLVSPPEGYLNSSDFTVVVSAADEAGGSGVDFASAGAAVDGVPRPASAVSVSGGRISVRTGVLSDGEHTVTVSAADFDGNVGTVSAVYHVDTVRPVLTLLSPPEGYVTVNRPTVLVKMTDEAGGSGVDAGTLAVLVDGEKQTAGVSVSGDTVTFTPAAALEDGRHVLTFSVRDRAGNEAALTAAYTVDTAPPELWVDLSDNHVVVDDETVTVLGRAWDLTANPVSVTVEGVPVPLDGDGGFSVRFPLAVGENRLQVRAVDAAGLASTAEVYRIRLITDRTKADLEELRALLTLPFEQWTDAERNWFNGGVVRGAYNADDLNRVELAAYYLAGWLTEYGYGVDVRGKRDWTLSDIPTAGQMERYRADVGSVKAALPAQAPLPDDLAGLELEEANDLERILVQADALRPMIDRSFVYSGEGFCGEF